MPILFSPSHALSPGRSPRSGTLRASDTAPAKLHTTATVPSAFVSQMGFIPRRVPHHSATSMHLAGLRSSLPSLLKVENMMQMIQVCRPDAAPTGDIPG
jgi:hypothetical protein